MIDKNETTIVAESICEVRSVEDLTEFYKFWKHIILYDFGKSIIEICVKVKRPVHTSDSFCKEGVK